LRNIKQFEIEFFLFDADCLLWYTNYQAALRKHPVWVIRFVGFGSRKCGDCPDARKWGLEDVEMETARYSSVLRTIPVLIAVCLVSLTAQAKYSGGTGEPNDPYQIATAEDLMLLGESPDDYDKHFIMTADIDLDPNLPGRKVFDEAVIAPDTNDIGWDFQGTAFTGAFNGNSHMISHLTVVGADCLGLFGLLSGEVRNVGLEDVSIDGSMEYIGGLVAKNGHWNGEGGVLTNCYSTGSVTGGSSVGGLVGYNHVGTVVHCHSSAKVSGIKDIGGLVGNNFEATVTDCYSTAIVDGNDSVGGLAGGIYIYGGSIAASYSTGEVSGNENVGGLVGSWYIYDDDWPPRRTPSPPMFDCFWDTQTSGQADSAGGIGKTTSQMQDIQTYLDAGWDFVGEINNGLHEIWMITELGGYPIFAIPTELQGKGTPEDPFLIEDALDLGAVTHYGPDAHYRVVADIDLAGIYWSVPVIPSLAGTFDSNGHKIYNLTIKDTASFFEELKTGGEIRDLCVVDVNVVGVLVRYNWGTLTQCHSTGRIVGTSGLVGWNYGILSHCSSSGVVISRNVRVGGLVGENEGDVIQCCSTATVTNTAFAAGGLVGENNGRVTTSYNNGSVTGGDCVGGLVGNNFGGSVTHCYSTGSVVGKSTVGGLVGYSYHDTVTHCYSTGLVSGDGESSRVGGLVGYSPFSHDISHGVWDMETSGKSGSFGGVGLTTPEMMDPYMLGLNGFANDPNWVLDAGRDYPHLAWEGTVGQMIPEPDVDWLEGGGTTENPYRIDTVDQLMLLTRASALWESHFVLGADIDLDPVLPGRCIFQQAPIQFFTGVFDGNGHVISRMTITGTGYLGLFGWLKSGAEIKNLGIEDVRITGWGQCFGSLVGYNNGRIGTSYSSGRISGTGSEVYAGGLVGKNGSYNAPDASVTNCCSHISVSVATDYGDVGGLVGCSHGSIAASYSSGLASGTDGKVHVGGLVGSNRGTVTDCYSAAAAVGDYNVGGLVGRSSIDITASFWDIQTSGSAGSDGGTGKTTAEMQTASTFLDAGWDFIDENANGSEDIWWILEGQDYPRLWWETEGN